MLDYLTLRKRVAAAAASWLAVANAAVGDDKAIVPAAANCAGGKGKSQRSKCSTQMILNLLSNLCSSVHIVIIIAYLS